MASSTPPKGGFQGMTGLKGSEELRSLDTGDALVLKKPVGEFGTRKEAIFILVEHKVLPRLEECTEPSFRRLRDLYLL